MLPFVTPNTEYCYWSPGVLLFTLCCVLHPRRSFLLRCALERVRTFGDAPAVECGLCSRKNKESFLQSRKNNVLESSKGWHCIDARARSSVAAYALALRVTRGFCHHFHQISQQITAPAPHTQFTQGIRISAVAAASSTSVARRRRAVRRHKRPHWIRTAAAELQHSQRRARSPAPGSYQFDARAARSQQRSR